jgi:hypothetical protein
MLGPKLGFLVVMPMALLYTAANAFVFVLCWFPANLQKDLQTKSPVLPSYAGPAVGTALSLLGGFYWIWDRHILPAIGYRFEVESERKDGYVVYMNFTVSYSKAACVCIAIQLTEFLQRYVSGFPQSIYEALDKAKKKLNAKLEERAKRKQTAQPIAPPPNAFWNTSGNMRRVGFTDDDDN